MLYHGLSLIKLRKTLSYKCLLLIIGIIPRSSKYNEYAEGEYKLAIYVAMIEMSITS